jgi:uncharacterized delta-60 repeat protein
LVVTLQFGCVKQKKVKSMKQLFELIVFFSIFCITLCVHAQLNNSFGNNGKVLVHSDGIITPIKLVENNSKLTLLSRYDINNTNNTKIHRYNSDGSVDTGFSSVNGLQLVDINLPQRNLIPRDLVVQGDGKIIVVGKYRENNTNGHCFITRLNENGSIDTNFANNGFHYPNMAPQFNWDYLADVKILSNGIISVVGYGGDNNYGIIALRYLPNGQLDTSFNNQGFVFTAINTENFIQLSDGKILAKVNGEIRRINQIGTFDSTFIPINNFESSSSFGIDNNNNIYKMYSLQKSYIYGTFSVWSSRYDVFLKRYQSNGQVDNSFGVNGEITFGMIGYYPNSPLNVFSGQNNNIYVGTSTSIISSTRYVSNGDKIGIAKISINGNVLGRYVDVDLNNFGSSAYTALASGKIAMVFRSNNGIMLERLLDIQDTRVNVRNSKFSIPSVFRPSSVAFHYYIGGSYSSTLGNSSDIPVVGSYCGAQALFRPSNGMWYSTCGQFQWGINGDIPIYIGDFDGDSVTDTAIFRPSSGVWAIKNTETGTDTILQWGQNGDKPVPGDYDGDGKDDIAVWRPSDGIWYILNSSNNQLTAIPFGTNGDIPVQEDYDGDGKFDVSVYRPSNGVWYRLNSSTNYGFFAIQWGISTDIPVPSDYNNDSKTDMAVYRDGNWYILTSDNYTFMAYYWGLPTDIPLARRQ